MAPAMRSARAIDTQSVAVNHAMYAYDFQIPARIPAQKLGVLQYNNGHGRFSENHTYTTPGITPSSAELAYHDANQVGLWVGMYLSNAYDLDSRAVAHLPNKKPQAGWRFSTLDGRELCMPDTVGDITETIPRHPRALRVVVPLGANLGHLNHYVLVDQQDGLCLGIRVPAERVFYFAECRDGHGSSVVTRRLRWRSVLESALEDARSTIAADHHDASRRSPAPSTQRDNEQSLREEENAAPATSSTILRLRRTANDTPLAHAAPPNNGPPLEQAPKHRMSDQDLGMVKHKLNSEVDCLNRVSKRIKSSQITITDLLDEVETAVSLAVKASFGEHDATRLMLSRFQQTAKQMRSHMNAASLGPMQELDDVHTRLKEINEELKEQDKTVQ